MTGYKTKWLLLILIFSISISVLAACSDGNSNEENSSYDDTGFTMGTVVNQTVYSEDKNIASDIISILTETEENYISWRVDDSDISKINKNAESQNPTEVSAETISYIEKALSISKDSDGAFDPTIGKLSRLWDFDNNPTDIPDEKKIDSLMNSVGYENISISNDEVSVKNDSSIDLGAMGKGIGCDKVQDYLEEKNDVGGYLVNIGGSSILTYGEKNDDEPWKVAVLNPRDEDNYLGSIALTGTNHVSTSGDYERYFEKDGKRYHHILDPSTGYPADSGLISVTVVTDNGSECDALSTACFVLGMNKAEKLLEKYDAEAIFVDEDKNIYVTKGLKEKFELMAEDFNLKD